MPSLHQQLFLVLCLHRVIETRFVTNQQMHFIRTAFYVHVHNYTSLNLYMYIILFHVCNNVQIMVHVVELLSSTLPKTYM